MTDDQARNVQQYEYDSFGNQHDMKNRIKQPYGYTGREHDRETGLRYYRARYYDGEVGVFLSKDPISFYGGSTNLYSYVRNNAINYIDPWGLKLQVLGSKEEVALINSWLSVFEECGADSEVYKRYKAIVDSSKTFTLKFANYDMIRAGQYSNYVVELDKALMDPNQKTFFYSPPFFSNYSEAYYGGPDTLAHELLGHGYDAANGDYNDNQQAAIDIANKVRDFTGMPRRGGWFDK